MDDVKKVWRRRAREYLAAAFGGKCTICGYNKTIAALDYHHIDPSQKDKALSILMRNGYSWDKIVVEMRKCTLVCCRCHREIHAGVTKLPDNCVQFNEAYVKWIPIRARPTAKPIIYDFCPICGKKKDDSLDYCSSACFHEQSKQFHITKKELKVLIATNAYEAIGRKFNVSGNAIKKRARVLGISLIPRKHYR